MENRWPQLSVFLELAEEQTVNPTLSELGL